MIAQNKRPFICWEGQLKQEKKKKVLTLTQRTLQSSKENNASAANCGPK